MHRWYLTSCCQKQAFIILPSLPAFLTTTTHSPACSQCASTVCIFGRNPSVAFHPCLTATGWPPLAGMWGWGPKGVKSVISLVTRARSSLTLPSLCPFLSATHSSKVKVNCSVIDTLSRVIILTRHPPTLSVYLVEAYMSLASSAHARINLQRHWIRCNARADFSSSPIATRHRPTPAHFPRATFTG